VYKRPARLLFLHHPDDRCADFLLRRVRAHSKWIEGRTLALPAKGDDLPRALAWADLVVTLGGCPPPQRLPPHVQHRHWQDTSPEALQRRLQGVVGGLRLLARLDASG